MQQFPVERLRNVALLSHGGTGKTSLAEAMLYNTGATTRLGKVEEGNTVSDYEPEEVKRASSIQTSVIPCVWQDHKVNILDAPGYADFFGEAVSALRVADAVVVPISAVAGVEVGTELIWKQLEERNLARLLFVNLMDRENADFYRALEEAQQRLGKKCVALYLPVGAESSFQGVVGLLNGQEAPADLQGQVETYRDKLVEAVADTDEALADKYLSEEAISDEELVQALKQGVARGDIVPVLVGSASMNIGARELLDAIVAYLPSPADVGPVRASVGGDREETLDGGKDGPLAALVFKTTADPFVGKLSYFRVYSGTLKSNGEVWNANKGQAERIGQVFIPRGKSQEPTEAVTAGDIGAVGKLSATTTGDTLCQKDKPYILPGITFPKPTYAVAVYPKSKTDLDKLVTALSRIVEEDPSLRVHRDPDTGETLIQGLGDIHIDVTIDKIKRKFGVEPELALPKVPYRETISVPAKTEYKHKKQTGGHGQYGHVYLALEPLPRGSGFEFANTVTGGNVPKEYIPGVEKGVQKALQEGVLAGYPVVDVKVTLYDGSYHSVDSSNMSFEIAGTMGTKQGLAKAQPILLEPILKVRVTVPDSFTGDVVGDLNSKRARILGMNPSDGYTVIEAEVPYAEMRRYATDLRSITQGRGLFTSEFHTYEPVPPHLAQRIVEEAKKEKEAARA